MCCQEDDKSSPVSSLYLSELHLFIAIFLVPFLLHLFLLSSLTLLRWLSLPFQQLSPNILFFIACPHFSVALYLLSFLSLSCLPSSSRPQSPLPHSPSSNLHPALPPHLLTSPRSHHLPRYVHPIYLSVTVFLTPSTLSSSVSLLPCLLPSVLRSSPGWRQLKQQTARQ